MKFSLPAATVNAVEIDQLIWALLLISLAIFGLVVWLLLYFIVKYRASSPFNRRAAAHKSWRFETAWTAATLAVFLGLFIWGANLYMHLFEPPADALQIYIVAKQWMWKVEHAGGQRELNTLHLPIGRPIELVMTSEDVIHDLSIPAFRIKHDVLPDRYETLWFTVTRAGTYHLFCTQFCGLDHSKMIGEVVALSPPQYEKWLAVNGAVDTLAAEGKVLFARFGCGGCHGENGAGESKEGSTVRAPRLAGLYGGPVPLSDGNVVIADDRYIRDSIVLPNQQIVAGYAPIMPSFAGLVDDEDLLKIVAYIKSMGSEPTP